MNAELLISNLRVSSAILAEIPGVQQGAPKREFFQFPALGGASLAGLPRGALIEISGAIGAGKTELVLRFLSVNSRTRVAWIEQEFTAYPCAFPQLGVNLDRVLFIQAEGEDPLWTVHQVIKSQVFGIAVVAVSSAAARDTVALRRLQIAAERAGCSVILLTEQPLSAACWPVSVQIHVSRDARSGTPAFRVLKYRGQQQQALAPMLEDFHTTTKGPSLNHQAGKFTPVTELAVQNQAAGQEGSLRFKS